MLAGVAPRAVTNHESPGSLTVNAGGQSFKTARIFGHRALAEPLQQPRAPWLPGRCSIVNPERHPKYGGTAMPSHSCSKWLAHRNG